MRISVNWWAAMVIENFIHSAVFSGEINPQSLQRQRLSEIFICLIKSIEFHKGQGYWAARSYGDKCRGLTIAILSAHFMMVLYCFIRPPPWWKCRWSWAGWFNDPFNRPTKVKSAFGVTGVESHTAMYYAPATVFGITLTNNDVRASELRDCTRNTSVQLALQSNSTNNWVQCLHRLRTNTTRTRCFGQ